MTDNVEGWKRFSYDIFSMEDRIRKKSKILELWRSGRRRQELETQRRALRYEERELENEVKDLEYEKRKGRINETQNNRLEECKKRLAIIRKKFDLTPRIFGETSLPYKIGERIEKEKKLFKKLRNEAQLLRRGKNFYAEKRFQVCEQQRLLRNEQETSDARLEDLQRKLTELRQSPEKNNRERAETLKLLSEEKGEEEAREERLKRDNLNLSRLRANMLNCEFRFTPGEEDWWQPYAVRPTEEMRLFKYVDEADKKGTNLPDYGENLETIRIRNLEAKNQLEIKLAEVGMALQANSAKIRAGGLTTEEKGEVETRLSILRLREEACRMQLEVVKRKIQFIYKSQIDRGEEITDKKDREERERLIRLMLATDQVWMSKEEAKKSSTMGRTTR
jgi:hypothetical protein